MHNQGKSIVEFGEEFLENKTSGHHILFLSIIGEIEGHDVARGRRMMMRLTACFC